MIPRNADVYDSDAVTDDELLSKLFSQTELDSVRNFLLGLKMFFLFPNRIQFGLENFIELLKICFPNRIGIGSETDTV